MIGEVETQAKVGIALESLWSALTKELRFVAQKAIPYLIKEVELIEGDGGLGSLLLFKFKYGDGVSAMTYQKEKIVELDESLHQITLQVIEGGYLSLGFSSYKTTFILTATGEQETMVHVIVSYESETQETITPSKTTESTLYFLKCLETYLLNNNNTGAS